MDISKTRRDNLVRVMGDPSERGTVSSFARKYGLDPTYIRQLISGHRDIGEKSARNIEEKAGLPVGYLDQGSLLKPDGPTSALDARLFEACRKAMELPPEELEAVVMMLERFQAGSRRDPNNRQ